MGTRGLRAYRHRKKYYIFYNHFDGYPSHLGQAVASEIPQDPEKYDSWVEEVKKWLEGLESQTEDELLTVSDAEMVVLGEKLKKQLKSQPRNDGAGFRLASLATVLGDEMHEMPSSFPPENDLFIEWVYTIDFDCEAFSLDNGAHFSLRHFPREKWADALDLDEANQRCVDLTLVPAEAVTSLVVEQGVPSKHMSGDLKAKVSVVRAKGLESVSETGKGMVLFLDALWSPQRKQFRHVLRYILLSLTPEDFLFREIAFTVIYLANGLSGNVRFADFTRSQLVGCRRSTVFAQSNTGDAAIASGLAVGVHRSNVKPGSAPAGTTYWYEGVLVHLTTNLDSDEHVLSEVQEMTEYGKATLNARGRLDVLLISLQHVVVVRIDAKSICRTPSMPLIYIKRHYETYAQERGQKKEAEVDDAKASLDANGKLDESAAFFALMRLFESGPLQDLKPESAREGVFPTEVYEMILDKVGCNTYRTCAFVSRKFRKICRSTGLPLNDTYFAAAFRSHGARIAKKQREPQP